MIYYYLNYIKISSMKIINVLGYKINYPGWAQKLIKVSDIYHIHKILGLIVLINFTFQLILFSFTGSMWLPKYIVIPHILLHLSSFQYKVLHFRIDKPYTNMFIWKEFRLHSTIFVIRSCAIILWPNRSYCIVILSMISADIVSYFYGLPNISTAREYYKYEKNQITKYVLRAYISISIISNTIICCGVLNKPSSILVFSTLPGIQISTFGMTLLRKKFISLKSGTIIYHIILLIVHIIWYILYNDILLFISAFIIYILRMLGLSKYIIWPAFFILKHCFNEYNLVTLYDI